MQFVQNNKKYCKRKVYMKHHLHEAPPKRHFKGYYGIFHSDQEALSIFKTHSMHKHLKKL